jgi:hypothetical protein
MSTTPRFIIALLLLLVACLALTTGVAEARTRGPIALPGYGTDATIVGDRHFAYYDRDRGILRVLDTKTGKVRAVPHNHCTITPDRYRLTAISSSDDRILLDCGTTSALLDEGTGAITPLAPSAGPGTWAAIGRHWLLSSDGLEFMNWHTSERRTPPLGKDLDLNTAGLTTTPALCSPFGARPSNGLQQSGRSVLLSDSALGGTLELGRCGSRKAAKVIARKTLADVSLAWGWTAWVQQAAHCRYVVRTYDAKTGHTTHWAPRVHNRTRCTIIPTHTRYAVVVPVKWSTRDDGPDGPGVLHTVYRYLMAPKPL